MATNKTDDIKALRAQLDAANNLLRRARETLGHKLGGDYTPRRYRAGCAGNDYDDITLYLHKHGVRLSAEALRPDDCPVCQGTQMRVIVGKSASGRLRLVLCNGCDGTGVARFDGEG